jgi:hypothetical protein
VSSLKGRQFGHTEAPDYSARHPATQHLMKWLVPNPRLNGIALDVAQVTWQAAQDLVALLRDGPELSAGLRKLREAKDCMVIQGLEDCEHVETPQ